MRRVMVPPVTAPANLTQCMAEASGTAYEQTTRLMFTQPRRSDRIHQDDRGRSGVADEHEAMAIVMFSCVALSSMASRPWMPQPQ